MSPQGETRCGPQVWGEAGRRQGPAGACGVRTAGLPTFPRAPACLSSILAAHSNSHARAHCLSFSRVPAVASWWVTHLGCIRPCWHLILGKQPRNTSRLHLRVASRALSGVILPTLFPTLPVAPPKVSSPIPNFPYTCCLGAFAHPGTTSPLPGRL